jgi:hypothetical protein
VTALGDVAGVVQLLDRHKRDCATIARRLGVPHLEVPESLSDAPFVPHRVIRQPLWKEIALWWPAREGLVVAEVLGSADAWAITDRAVGVHPMVRLIPPTGLRRFAPRTLLVGHGPPLTGPDTARLMEEAIAHSRREAPRLLLKMPSLIRTGRQL